MINLPLETHRAQNKMDFKENKRLDLTKIIKETEEVEEREVDSEVEWDKEMIENLDRAIIETTRDQIEIERAEVLLTEKTEAMWERTEMDLIERIEMITMKIEEIEEMILNNTLWGLTQLEELFIHMKNSLNTFHWWEQWLRTLEWVISIGTKLSKYFLILKTLFQCSWTIQIASWRNQPILCILCTTLLE